MNGREAILAAMAPADGEMFERYQLTYLMFLLDRHVAPAIGGPFFDFKGTGDCFWDDDFIAELDKMADDGLLVNVDKQPGVKRLTVKGQRQAVALFNQLPGHVRKRNAALVRFLRGKKFIELGRVMGERYPEMNTWGLGNRW